MTHQILIVEDHPIMRQAYTGVLSREADLTLCGAAKSAEEALTMMATLCCDLVIVDVSLPGMDGIEFVEHIQRDYPGLPALVISAFDEDLLGERARKAGAQGYLNKHGLAHTLAPTIRQILKGEALPSRQASPSH